MFLKGKKKKDFIGIYLLFVHVKGKSRHFPYSFIKR